MNIRFSKKKNYLVLLLILFSLFFTSCTFDFKENVLFVFLNKETPKMQEELLIKKEVIKQDLNDVILYINETFIINLENYFSGDYNLKQNEGFEHEFVNKNLILKGIKKGEWVAELIIQKNDAIIIYPFKIIVMVYEENNFENNQTRNNQTNELKELKPYMTEIRTVTQEISINIIRKKPLQTPTNKEIKPGIKICYPREPINEQEQSFFEELTNLTKEQEILEFATKNFKIINQEQTLKPAFESYKEKEGSLYDFYRLTAFAFMFNCYHTSIIVYEYEENHVIKYDAVLVYSIPEAKYLYYENNHFEINNAGTSFEELMQMEEQRKNIKINKYGAISFSLITNEEFLEITNTLYWVEI